MNYDMNTQRQVETFWTNNEDKRRLYETSDLRRLEGRDGLDTLITTRELQTTVKSFRNNTPGETKMNKTILENIPDIALTKLQWIFNHALSLGYFPDRFKTAVIKLIPKPNTDQTNPINYRPISLLEVTDKILEKTMNRRLRNDLGTHNKLPHTQH